MRHWGITGTNGKTTTTWILAEFINACPGRRCGYVTTVEVNTGTRRFYTGYTTPPLAQLKEIFAEMEANGCTDCAMEVSSHAIVQHRTGDTVFAGGAFTNLSEDHLDYHKTMAAYFDAKLDFARQIAATHPAAPDAGRRDLAPYAVCLDGGYGREMFEQVGTLPLNAIPVRADGEGAPLPRYDLSELPLVGAYNRSNTLVAAALAEQAGVPHDVIQRTIPKLTPRWGRLEYVPCASKAKVYVDFAHTPDGLEKVLAAVRGEMAEPSNATANRKIEKSNNSLWVVFGAGGDRDPMKRPLMGDACARLADELVVTSDNPRSEDPRAIIDAILAGVGGRRAGHVTVEPDRRKAIFAALSAAREGDVVVIAGKGHETTQEIKGVKHPFDDRAVVREYAPEKSGVWRRGFTLLEVLLASVILGFGLTTILVSMQQSQKMMIASTFLQTAQEVMDLGDMAYPLADVKDPDEDLDVEEMKATELWDLISPDVRLTREQEEKYHGYTWRREALNRQDDEDEIKRLGNLYTVRVTVRWGDDRRGNHEEESYVTFWRKPES